MSVMKRQSQSDDDIQLIEDISVGPKRKKTSQSGKEHEQVSSHIAPSDTFAIAIPPLATTVNQIPADISAEIACEIVATFLASHDNPQLRVVVVDEKQETIEAFQRCWPSKDPQFSIVHGKITEIGSRLGIPCRWYFILVYTTRLAFMNPINCSIDHIFRALHGAFQITRVIVNETTWRLKQGATPVSKQIEDVAGVTMWDVTKRKYPKPGVVGNAYPIVLPSTSPLFLREGVRHIVHVIPPNVNSLRPDPVPLEQAKTLLRRAYWSVLEAYLRLLDEGDKAEKEIDEEEKVESEKKKVGNEKEIEEAPKSQSLFDILMSSSASSSASSSPAKTLVPVPIPRSTTSGWSDALTPYCDHPEQFGSEEVYWYDREIVVAMDKFPKAMKHFLIMPRHPINGLKSLTRKHVSVLEKLVTRGSWVVERMKEENPRLEFRMGFHAVPSMRQLHMHVVSQDFISPKLKNKKHWNSFTTAFFIDAVDVIKRLKDCGVLTYAKDEYEPFLKASLQCHLCKEEPRSVPALKAHLERHAREKGII